MKGIILEIDGRSLAELLYLPKEAAIMDIQRDINMENVWLIRVTGAGPEVALGAKLPRITGLLTKRTIIDVNWGTQ